MLKGKAVPENCNIENVVCLSKYSKQKRWTLNLSEHWM